jgi:hypothetical protein
MKRKQSWPSLLLFAALLAIAVSPVSALAGKGDRPTDLPGDPPIFPEEYEFGDPDPGAGRPQQWGDLEVWYQILLASMRNAALVPSRPVLIAKPRVASSSTRTSRGSSR